MRKSRSGFCAPEGDTHSLPSDIQSQNPGHKNSQKKENAAGQNHAGRLRGVDPAEGASLQPQRAIDEVLNDMLATKHDPSLERRWLDPSSGKATPTHPAVERASSPRPSSS